jgi:hypothetical protein
MEIILPQCLKKNQSASRKPNRLQKNRATADKSPVDISAIALQGLETSQAQFDQAAGRLASVGSPSPGTASVDTVDLSAQTISLLSAKNAFELNLSVMKIANEMQSHLVDLLG